MKKKKVGIITLHRVVNYGSVLQTYALQEKIKSLNCDVEVIDYYPRRLTMLGMLERIKNKGEKFQKNFLIRNLARLIILPSYILRFNTFFSFLKKHINLSKKIYKDEIEINNEKFDYDIYCTGSDQVWNCGWNEKFDAPYYLSFAPDNKKKIAYAASFGKSKLDVEEKEATKKYLLRYDNISLRELSGVKIVASGGVKSLEDIKALKKQEAVGIEGVIAGKSIYMGTLDLTTAINVFLRKSIACNGFPFDVRNDVPNNGWRLDCRK